MFLDSHGTVFIFRSWFDLLDVVLTCVIFILKIFKSFQNYKPALQILQASGNVQEVLPDILGISVQIWYLIVSRICFTRNHSPGLLRWFNIQTKEGQRLCEVHLIRLENTYTASKSTVWPGDRREDDMSCVLSFYNLVHTVPEALHSD